MTNAQIIFQASQELAEAGIIGYTGREFEAIDGEGNKIMMKETEEIHTYAAWKELGYQVQKGQKAVAKITIWKCTVKPETIKDSNGTEITQNTKNMFMKNHIFPLRSRRVVLNLLFFSS